jgi:hypothetical protein
MTKEDFVKEAIKTDVKLRKQLFTDELNRYFESYQKTTDRCRLFQKELKEIHSMPSVTTPNFLNKVVVAVLGHIAEVHTVIADVSESSGSRHKKEYLATHQGIRVRSGYSSRSRDLNGADVVEIFTTKAKAIEDWFAKEKPKKLADFVMLKNAFLANYQDGFCSKYDPYSNDRKAPKFFDHTVKLSKPVTILEEGKYGGYEVKRNEYSVSKILLRYSIESNSFKVYLIDESKTVTEISDKELDGDGVLLFDFSDALKYMEARDLMPDINMVVMGAWFDGFKLAMNKYVSIMGL